MVFLPLLLSAPTWFGPASFDQALPTTGNPFSPTENNVHAVFTKGGRKFDRLAYFAKGQWHAILSAPVGGTFTGRFYRNGQPIGKPGSVTLRAASDSEFVKQKGTRFQLTSGKPFVPFGHNFGWQNGRDRSYPEQLKDMAAAGLNWTRVWSNMWDGKNPYFPRESTTKLALGTMDEPSLNRWDMVIAECERNRIHLQFVLFHHGLFSTTTDSNWSDHPWNAKNGGFLADPTDFFVNPQAKTLARAWLRYAVARWGHSPSIMAWELFNEVQWVDAAKVHPERIGDVVAWHKEMGAYVRSIDPYHHLVTSSSNENLDPRVFETMDYEQPHTYPPSVYGAILGAPKPKDRPVFFGEFGGTGSEGSASREAGIVRDGFWGGLLAGQAGPGQYWYWDRAYRAHLYPEFTRLSKVLAQSGFAEHPSAAPTVVTVTGATPSDLVVRPGRGWGPTDRFVYQLPQDAASGALPTLSGYIQGAQGGNRALMREPIRFRFTAKTAGQGTVRIGQASKGGGDLSILVNGSPAATRAYPGGTGDRPVNEDVKFPFGAGQNEITIDNPGQDWITLDSVSLPGIGSGISAVGFGETGYALARLQWQSPPDASNVTVGIAGLADGTYEMRQFNLDDGQSRTRRVTIRQGKIAGYRPIGRDEAIALFRRPSQK